MWLIVTAFVQWFFRVVVIKCLIFTALFAVVELVVPFALGYVLPFASAQSLTSAFAGFSPALWYFVDLFRIDFGLPFVLSALVARFLIRRLPVIG